MLQARLQLRLFRVRDRSTAARGRYERLAVPPCAVAPDEFSSAARSLCSIVEVIAAMFADLSERIADVCYGNTGLYLSDTCAWLQAWDNNAAYDQCLDDHYGCQQDQYFPQP